MFLPLRTAIIFFLVLLQLIAPSVHAHTGEHTFKSGFHIHSLEALEHAHYLDSAPLSQSVSAHDAEGQLIGITTGLQAKYSNTADDNGDPDYITPTSIAIKATLSEFDTNFSPQQHPATQSPAYPHPARAPPQHTPA